MRRARPPAAGAGIAAAHLQPALLGEHALLRTRAKPAEDDRPKLAPEVEAVLDYEGGLASYHRNEEWRQGVIDHFRFNLRRMVEMVHRAGVPIILLNPVANLDTPPFKAEHRSGISAEDRRRFEALWEEARQEYRRSLPKAIVHLKQAIAVDDQHAGIHYTLAECYKDIGRLDEARAEFLRAKDLDICPLRILEPMNQATLDIARDRYPGDRPRRVLRRDEPGRHHRLQLARRSRASLDHRPPEDRRPPVR